MLNYKEYLRVFDEVTTIMRFPRSVQQRDRKTGGDGDPAAILRVRSRDGKQRRIRPCLVADWKWQPDRHGGDMSRTPRGRGSRTAAVRPKLCPVSQSPQKKMAAP